MRLISRLSVLLLLVAVSMPATALDDAHWKKADASIKQGIAYLRTQQAEDGSWMGEVGPAVTGMVLTALLEQPDIAPDDEQAAKAIKYILDRAQEDGSIRNGPDGILASYNTAICLSALARVGNSPEVAEAIRKGQEYLKGSQWIIGMKDPNGKVIDENHPYVGGFGYGKNGRPDLSNTQIALQALHDTGVDCEDPAFQRALTFLNRLQATEDNDLYADKMEEHDGGFIYAPSVNQEQVDKPESKANQDQIDEAKLGKEVSGLRTYGSMTYAGFKSLLYADLDRDDKRIQAALGWIANNYQFDVNPGMPEEQKLQGLFYYYLTMARAMNAYGSSTIEVNTGETGYALHINPEYMENDGDGIKVDPAAFEPIQKQLAEKNLTVTDLPIIPDKTVANYSLQETKSVDRRDWANDLIATVTARQAKDGSWANSASRWMEDKPVLVTAYSVIALQNAID